MPRKIALCCMFAYDVQYVCGMLTLDGIMSYVFLSLIVYRNPIMQMFSAVKET